VNQPSLVLTHRPGKWTRRFWFGIAVVVQLVVLYAPRAPSTGGLPIDKVVHAFIFGFVLWTGVRAGLAWLPLAAVLAVHAVASELIQNYLLAHRDGDWTDSAADLAGVVIVTAILRRRN
jgi:hypothetical protein